jgi:hypothetical protein
MLQFKTKSSALAALTARKTNLTGGFAHLYQDDGFVPDQNSTLADLNAHEANYTGYAPGGIALAAPTVNYVDGVNRWAFNFPTVAFSPVGGPITSNDIRGVYFEDGAASLDEVWIFDEPVTLATILDAVLVDPKFTESAATETV